MLMTKERPSGRFIERWAIRVLLEAHAIKECGHHGHMQCRGDPEARAEAFEIAHSHPLAGISPEDAVAAVHDVLGNIGEVCPEC